MVLFVAPGQFAIDPGGFVCRRARCWLGSCTKWPPNSQSVHQASKGVRVKIQDGASAPRSADHPSCPPEHAQNMLALDLFERIAVVCLSDRVLFDGGVGFFNR